MSFQAKPIVAIVCHTCLDVGYNVVSGRAERCTCANGDVLPQNLLVRDHRVLLWSDCSVRIAIGTPDFELFERCFESTDPLVAALRLQGTLLPVALVLDVRPKCQLFLTRHVYKPASAV